MTKIKNIGPKSASWLREIGILTLEDVEAVVVVEIYKRLKLSRPNVSKVMLYALQGAIMDLHWQEIPDAIREDLLAQAEVALADSTDTDTS